MSFDLFSQAFGTVTPAAAQPTIPTAAKLAVGKPAAASAAAHPAAAKVTAQHPAAAKPAAAHVAHHAAQSAHHAVHHVAAKATTPAAERTPLHLGNSSGLHAAAAGGGSGILRTLVALVVVAAVIYGIAWVLKKVKGGGLQGSNGEGLAQVATLQLGSGKSVALVRAGRELMLVGIAEHGVTALRTYTETEAVELGLPLRNESEASAVREPVDAFSDKVVDRLRRMTVRS